MARAETPHRWWAAGLLLTIACTRPEPALSPGMLARPVVRISLRGPVREALTISLQEYRREVARLRFEREDSLYAAPLPEPLKRHVLDRMIERRLVAHEAERLGVRASTAAVDRELAAIRGSYPPQAFARALADAYQTEAELSRAIAERLTASLLIAREAQAASAETALEAAWNARPEAEKPTTEPERTEARERLRRELETEAARRAEATLLARLLKRATIVEDTDLLGSIE